MKQTKEMNVNSEEMTGITSLGTYSSADFSDSYEVSPSHLLLENSSYSNAVNNAMNKHYSELREKTTIHQEWNKKFRDLFVTKNTKLLEFLTCKLRKHPVLNSAEHFFQLFQNPIHFNKSMKEIVLDISGSSGSSELNRKMEEKGFQSIEKFIEQGNYILDEYKLSIDKILDKEKLLKMKLDSLDSMNNRIKNIASIDNNEHYPELMGTIEKYIGKIFENNMIEADYTDVINEYKQFISLREILRVIRRVDIIEKEPLCGICFDNSITHAFVPCGHTFCSVCMKRQALTCSVCRTGVRDMVKIYFS